MSHPYPIHVEYSLSWGAEIWTEKETTGHKNTFSQSIKRLTSTGSNNIWFSLLQISLLYISNSPTTNTEPERTLIFTSLGASFFTSVSSRSPKPEEQRRVH